jgi:Tol biopolymer transport system component
MRIRWLLTDAAIVGLLFGCGGPREPAPASPPRATTDLGRVRPETGFSGRILFQSDLDGDNEIYVLTAEGLTKLTDNAWDDRYPRWSPDGKRIAFSANPRGSFDLFVMDPDGKNPEAVTDTPEDELDVAWAPDGNSLVFTRDARRIPGGDEATWTIDLASRRTVEAVRGFHRSNGLADISPATRGIVFTGKRRLGGWGIFYFDPRDESVRELAKGGGACRPRFSPDGRKIVYVSSGADGKGDIWVMNADGSAQDRITARDDTFDYFPSWSPDGTQIVFCSNARDKYADRGDWGLYLISLAGREAVRLLDTAGRDVFPDWR